jgi:hypothetical protein
MPDAHAQAVQYFLNQYFGAGVPGYGYEVGTTVLSRQRPDYDPLGIRAGDVIVRPQVTESLGYNSNVLGINSSAISSFQENTTGSVALTSDWGGANSIGGEVAFDNRILPNVSQMNRTDASASVGGTHAFGRDTLTLAGSFLYLHQDPTGIDAAPFQIPGQIYTAPIPYTIGDLRAAYTVDLGRLTLTPAFNFTSLNFQNTTLFGVHGAVVPPPVNGFVLGIPVNQSYRDRNLYDGSVTARYEFAPLRSAIFVVRDTAIDYTSAQKNSFGPQRSGNGLQVLAGLEYTANGVFTYRVLAGYQQRTFQESAYTSQHAPIFEANVIWTPTGLTTVSLRAISAIADASNEAVAAYQYRAAHLQLDHELLRNVLLTGYVGLENASYLGTTGSQMQYFTGGGVTWLVNRTVHISLTDDFLQQTGSNGFATPFTQNVALLQFRVGL